MNTGTNSGIGAKGPLFPVRSAMARNVVLFPRFRFLQNLLFWQATWFLYFQQELSAAEAIVLYVIFDLTVTVLEVPSGYMSDRLGRRVTLLVSGVYFLIGLVFLSIGDSFAVFAAGQLMLGAGIAFSSGTDTALLYQSLVALGRANSMEKETVRAWRAAFMALALSALIGGSLAFISPRLPFVAAAVTMLATLWVTWQFTEPQVTAPAPSERARMQFLVSRFRNPALMWIFALSVTMYVFSHVPFVFGQPFIAETLGQFGVSELAPLLSGTVTALMMGFSLLVSLAAPRLRARLGLAGILLLAFTVQVGLVGALAASGTFVAIAFLLARMVSDSLSTPFIQAHLQPMLGDEIRATFMSVKSLAGRVVFAISLSLAAVSTTIIDEMPMADIKYILGWYTVAGTALMLVFSWYARSLERPAQD